MGISNKDRPTVFVLFSWDGDLDKFYGLFADLWLFDIIACLWVGDESSTRIFFEEGLSFDVFWEIVFLSPDDSDPLPSKRSLDLYARQCGNLCSPCVSRASVESLTYVKG